MEWEQPGIVLDTHLHGEGDLVVTLLTPRGLWKGLAKGGASRKQAALWQRGNILAARWIARTADQLGAITGELVRPAAALAMAAPETLEILNAACALAAGALPEREEAPESFAGLLRLLAGIDIPGFALPELCRWEVALLRELGFGLDFSSSAGGNDRLAYVSPRTGRAVTLSEAGEWVDRLLPLPAFLIEDVPARPEDCVAALRLTGHFLARDVFGARHKPLPPARAGLYERLSRSLEEKQTHAG
ncbi:DNA repair protein RecO [Acidocella sp. KAb 2-4]|uniref:DNA repair protein RecO n=1 Tax=Acidocella sp. KAb 2-4 TaxID=2885158 RepID=UPI001D08057A|nr:DNA repair protein RecO [Acidocella sp. KAb 2-4]MCB5943130.1 DNA repair protein RecO [Acidocella sp. KAb 2-4]